MRKIVAYIVYGENQSYYDGVKYSFLTFLNWVSENDPIEIVVLTQKPEEFKNYPVNVFRLTDDQINQWSINGAYHFRIKNRGLAYLMDELNLKFEDKILFFDADTYFHKSPLNLFNFINSKQALFYLNEGLIYKRKRFEVYVKHLEGKTIEIGDKKYQLSKKSALWGSLMIGIMPNMRHSLEWADLLMLKFYEIVPSHTIEPFSLSESLLKDYKIVEGKRFVSLYSTSRKKQYASMIISKFFEENKALNSDELIQLSQNVKLKRPIMIILKQRFKNLKF
jgi:heptosyltransferase-3